MEIEEIIEHKKALEKEFYLKILQLEQLTGVKVAVISIRKFHHQIHGFQVSDPEKSVCPLTITMEI